MVDETMVVFVPAAGTAPFPLLKLGVLGEVARNSTYPLAVAPLAGKEAAVQLIFKAVLEVAVPDKFVACAVGALDKVRNVPSDEYPVPNELVAYPL